MNSGNDLLELEIEAPPEMKKLHLVGSESSVPMEVITVRPESPRYVRLKSLLDIIAAILLLVFLTPVILLFAAAIRLSKHSPGPAFYFQKRLGLNGREYTMVKLRTMMHNAESKSGAVWSTTNDTRITRLGMFLRKTQIDEFPQLWNVLMGQMSLIGPRPERPEIVDRLEMDIPYYRQRLKVKPGITGLAQLILPADSDLESVRRKLIPDLYYVKKVSFGLDLQILIHTLVYFIVSVTKYACSSYALPTQKQAKQTLVPDFEQEEQIPESKAS